ncbi:MAG: hypothetical protein ACE5IR_22445 [bacterium]
MERFIKFEKEINMEHLKSALSQHNPGIMLLRHSKLTGTVKVRAKDDLTKREIKQAFQPYKVRKIYDDFPVKMVRS